MLSHGKTGPLYSKKTLLGFPFLLAGTQFVYKPVRQPGSFRQAIFCATPHYQLNAGSEIDPVTWRNENRFNVFPGT